MSLLSRSFSYVAFTRWLERWDSSSAMWKVMGSRLAFSSTQKRSCIVLIILHRRYSDLHWLAPSENRTLPSPSVRGADTCFQMISNID